MTELWSDHVTQEPSLVETTHLDFSVNTTQFENGVKQFALKSATPEQAWRLQWDSIDEADIDKIFNFYARRSGRFEAFNWLHPYETTTLSAGGGGELHIHVAAVNRALAGDVIVIDGTAQSILTADAVSSGNLTFVEGGASKDTITGAGFDTAGFLAGHSFTVTDSASNDGTYTLFGVAAGTLTLIATDDLADEGPVAATVTAKAIDESGLIINLQTSNSSASGVTAQLRYSVRFAAELTLETIKAWVYRIGIPFERNL